MTLKSRDGRHERTSPKEPPGHRYTDAPLGAARDNAHLQLSHGLALLWFPPSSTVCLDIAAAIPRTAVNGQFKLPPTVNPKLQLTTA